MNERDTLKEAGRIGREYRETILGLLRLGLTPMTRKQAERIAEELRTHRAPAEAYGYTREDWQSITQALHARARRASAAWRRALRGLRA